MIGRALAGAWQSAFVRRVTGARRSTAAAQRFERFIGALQAHGYTLRPLDEVAGSPGPLGAYLRHDVRAGEIGAGLRLAELHQSLRVPGTFHLAWDVIDGSARLMAQARRFNHFDRQHVRLGLQCDPLSRWLADTRFGGDLRQVDRFALSSEFAAYLDEMLGAWRRQRGDAPALRAAHDGAWETVAALDRSFRSEFGAVSSISGRGTPLSAAFSQARQARPELVPLTPWFSPIDYLLQCDLGRLGYRCEATRFLPGGGPGPVAVFGGAGPAELREAIELRIAGGGGLVAIFPADHWEDERYGELLSPPVPGPPVVDIAESVPDATVVIPDEPFITREKHLVRFGRRCERVDKHQLAAAARHIVGGAIDRSFPHFVAWLRDEGYQFAGFDDGPLRLDERFAYLRYDVHIQDLLAAYVLADLHARMGIVGSFQIMWKFSGYEEALEPYFAKLLEFDRRYVHFGLHAAPTASWYLHDKLGGDYSRQSEAMAGEEFAEWVLDLHKAYCRDGNEAPGLREIRAGTDDTLSRIAQSFWATFGRWRSLSAHGNYLTNGFLQVCERHPEVEVLRPYFHPVAYLEKWGVSRFGFDYEVTSVGSDSVPYPRVMLEGNPEEVRRRWYRGRVAHGAGFVALLHPATWTCSQNARFFLPGSDAEEAALRPRNDHVEEHIEANAPVAAGLPA